MWEPSARSSVCTAKYSLKGFPPMALSESAVSELLEVLRTGDAVDLIRESVRMVLQELIETEASDVIGAARYERTDSRVNERNGSRPRILATQAGDIDLRIPKLPGAVRGGDGGLRRRRVHPRCR
jgi:putative transposase